MIDNDTQIICTGTAWVEQIGAPGIDLQFSRRGLDISFLMTLNLILQGRTYTEAADASRAGRSLELGVRRVGGSIPAAGQAAHIYELSAAFCERLAELLPVRVDEIARDWYALQGHAGSCARVDRVEYRAGIIQNLAAMAQVVQARGARLLLQTTYDASS